jgi:DmsE family decaheme c-type cytochrome
MGILVVLAWGQSGAQEEKATYIGDDLCLGCHRDFVKPDWSRKRHNRYLLSTRLLPKPESRGCEGCHGPGSLHAGDPEHKHILNLRAAPAKRAAEVCLRCHKSQIVPARWLATSHARHNVYCGACHDAHATTKEAKLLRKKEPALCFDCHKEQAAEFRMNAHHPVLEGRLVCTGCHDVHEQQGDAKQLKDFEDLCVTCHAEKRGPFVFEHEVAPGNQTEKCLACHRPHGSPNLKLLEFSGRGLCLQCHTDIATDSAHQARPGDCWQAGCHVRIHGSNRTRLFFN